MFCGRPQRAKMRVGLLFQGSLPTHLLNKRAPVRGKWFPANGGRAPRFEMSSLAFGLGCIVSIFVNDAFF